MEAPRVSVIVPCYDLGQYLDEAVDSVLAQTFQDFEIVVVDDGSTDAGTRRLLGSYEKPRTRVVRSENRGLPAAKNLGLLHTRGPYVCMLDADDRLEPTMLQKSVAVLDEDPSIAFVSHWLRTFGDEAWEWTPARCDAPALLDVNTVNGAALVRRSALEAVGGFDESMRDGCEDWDIWLSLIEHGCRGVILPEVLFHYRRRPESMSRAMMRGDRHPRLYRYLVEKHTRLYRDHVGALVIRREDDIASLRRHIHDLELERFRWLDPELSKWRSDVEVLERKAARAAHGRARDEEFAALTSAVERAESDRLAAARRVEEQEAQMRAAAEDAAARLHAATATLDRARADAEALRHDRDQQKRAFETARARALELDAARNRASVEADELRRSISWRMTKPLRVAYDAMRRVAGRTGS
jgi:glycosyltransferase involved in cell wall biosynthesis